VVSRVARDLYLNMGFESQGPLRLDRANIGGDLNCSNGRFLNPSGEALGGMGVKVGGYLQLMGSVASGAVIFADATISGSIEAENARFSCTNGGPALRLDGARINGRIGAERLLSSGLVSLVGVRVGGGIRFNEGAFSNHNAGCVVFDAASVAGVADLSDVRIDGILSLTGSKIDGPLRLNNSTLRNGNEYALTADGATIDVLSLNGSRVMGCVGLTGVHLADSLDCQNCQITNAQGGRSTR